MRDGFTFNKEGGAMTVKKKRTTKGPKWNPFIGRIIAVTGKLENFTRDTVNAKIESLGATAGSSVSKNTDYLICGEKAGSKLGKAKSLGVKILSEREFLSMAGSENFLTAYLFYGGKSNASNGVYSQPERQRKRPPYAGRSHYY
jgi:hypothetical protein